MVQAPVGEVSRPPPHVGRKSVQRRHQARSEPVLPPKTPAAVQPVGLRRSLASSLAAGISRLIATGVSFALCLAYLVIFPFHPVGLAALLGLGTAIMMRVGRRDDIVTTGITTVVVMVAAAISPQDAWHQPLLRLVDTVVGIAVGVACKWIGSFLIFGASGSRHADRIPGSSKTLRVRC